MKIFNIFLLLLYPIVSVATPARLLDLRLWQETENNTRLIFDISNPMNYKLFTLNSPNRLVIDFESTLLSNRLSPPPKDHNIVTNIRSAPRNDKDLRVVFDLKTPVSSKSFLLKPEGIHGHRLVIDLNTLGYVKPITRWLSPPQSQTESSEFSTPSVTQIVKIDEKYTDSTHFIPELPVKTYPTVQAEKTNDVLVAIDAGHGGIDPGAVGKNGTQEKEVVLAIARKLMSLIAKEPGFQPVMIRTDDYFIKLRERIELARAYQADIFISIHADAYEEAAGVRGSSVYMLSQGGASTEAARWLAEKENAADLIGGVSLSDKDDLLASVLLDLSQAGTLEASAHLADKVLATLSMVSKPHYERVQQAGFVVLRSPDIPSVLVETGFISNSEEEDRLKKQEYQQKIAYAILQGIQNYFMQRKQSDTVLAKQNSDVWD